MMSAHQRIVDAARRAGQPIYLVTGLYVGVGFVVGAYGAVRGDRLAAFLGFLFISGAICAALLFHAMARLAVRVSAIGLTLDELRGSISRLERMTAARAAEEPNKNTSATSNSRTVNLATFGRGDPSTLAAATLDRNRFPRLVTTMDENWESEKEAPLPSEENATNSSIESGERENGSSRTGEVGSMEWTLEWDSACRAGDLEVCRRLFSAVVDTADPQVVARFAEDLATVSERAEQTLRRAFSESFRRGDIAGAMRVGRQIVEQFPDQPIAEEFEKIRPHLIRRFRSTTSKDEATISVLPG